jgi:hypothetical protein
LGCALSSCASRLYFAWPKVDPWEDLIREYLKTQDRVRVGDIAKHVLAIEVAATGTREQRRITSILTALGWVLKRSNGVRWYAPR